jgi:outer membrane protein OmpA-like peptidoglycan-associated protein
MARTKSLILLATAGTMALAACTPVEEPTEDPNRRTKEGALIGAAAGAAIGILTGDNARERRRGAVLGAAVGGAAGGLIGNNLDRQAAELNRDLSNNVEVVNTGEELIVVMPQDILFDFNSAALRPDLRSDLGVLAASLNDYPETTVDVIGHTDNIGEAGYNQDLSARRAQSVTRVLSANGVALYRLRAIGRGEAEPVATNQTEAGRAQNRRVEIIIRPTS